MNKEEGDNIKDTKNKQKYCVNHQTQKPNWFCVESNCQEKIRFACGDCILDCPHNMHQHKKLIDYQGIILQRCPERLQKLREIQQISEIKKSTTETFKYIREDFNSQINHLEKATDRQIRLIEHNFSNRFLTEFKQKIKLLQNKLLFFKFLFCEEEISDLSLNLYNHQQYLEPEIEKEKEKREFINNQFKDHLQNIKETYEKFSNSIQKFTINFQAQSQNTFDLEKFTQKIEKINESHPAHTQPIHKVVTLTHNRFMSFSDDTTMQIFNQNNKLISTINHDSKINHADVLSDDLVVISSSDYNISVYNIEKNELVKKYSRHTEPIISLRVIDENKFASGGFDKNLFVWSLDQDEPLLLQENANDGFVYCIEAIRANKFATGGGDDGKIKIWEDLKVVSTINGHSNKIQNLKYISNLNILISADDHGVIMIWNLSDLSLINKFSELYKEPLLDIIQLSDNLFCTLGVEQIIKVFKIEYEQDNLQVKTNGQTKSNNDVLDKDIVISGKKLKNISVAVSFSTNQSINSITKYNENIIIGGCQDGNIITIQ